MWYWVLPRKNLSTKSACSRAGRWNRVSSNGWPDRAGSSLRHRWTSVAARSFCSWRHRRRPAPSPVSARRRSAWWGSRRRWSARRPTRTCSSRPTCPCRPAPLAPEFRSIPDKSGCHTVRTCQPEYIPAIEMKHSHHVPTIGKFKFRYDRCWSGINPSKWSISSLRFWLFSHIYCSQRQCPMNMIFHLDHPTSSTFRLCIHFTSQLLILPRCTENYADFYC